jgi:hypothetical protein
MTFLIAMWNNLHLLVFIAALIVGASALVFGAMWGNYTTTPFKDERDVQHAASYKRLFKKAAIATAILATFATIPDVNDLWRARIALVKLELASPENVQKGTEAIERIARRLECKYLGCEEEKEKAP